MQPFSQGESLLRQTLFMGNAIGHVALHRHPTGVQPVGSAKRALRPCGCHKKQPVRAV